MSERQRVSQRPCPSIEKPMKPGPQHHSKARFCFGIPLDLRKGMNCCPKSVPPPSSSLRYLMSIPAKRTWRDGRAHRRIGLTNSFSTRLRRPIFSVLKLVADIATNYHAPIFDGIAVRPPLVAFSINASIQQRRVPRTDISYANGSRQLFQYPLLLEHESRFKSRTLSPGLERGFRDAAISVSSDSGY
jgi:hypothetical protein